jgi:hypothetical protein
VIVLRLVELIIRYNFGDDRFLPDLLIVKLLNHMTSNLLLLLGVIEYRGAILVPTSAPWRSYVLG